VTFSPIRHAPVSKAFYLLLCVSSGAFLEASDENESAIERPSTLLAGKQLAKNIECNLVISAYASFHLPGDSFSGNHTQRAFCHIGYRQNGHFGCARGFLVD